MPRLVEPDPFGLPGLVLLEQARAAGLTDDQVRHRLRSGRWTSLGRGVYLRGDLAGVEAYQRVRLEHVSRAIAAAHTHADSVIALESAAAMHDLPTVSQIPRRVHLISETGHAGPRGEVSIHRLPLEQEDVFRVAVPVTSPLRTWVDIARFGSLADALAVGDHGLRRGDFDDAAARRAARAVVTGRGWRKLRLAADLLDGRRESPLESWSAARFHEWGLAQPRPQAVVHDDAGRFVARVDVLWERRRVVGEADGALKYDDPQALYDEKRREDRLRELGFTVVRWGWTDLRRGDDLRRRLSALVGETDR